MEAARRQLAMAFLEHKAACEAFDAALGERPRGRLTLLSSVEQDPWVTGAAAGRGRAPSPLGDAGAREGAATGGRV